MGPYGGTATSVAIDPSNPKTVLLGARNSIIFQSRDAGATWTRLPFPRHFLGTVQSLVVDPTQSQYYYAAVAADGSPNGGVWMSTDAGRTWKIAKDTVGTSAEALAISPRDPKVLVAGTHQGVWRTRDGGKAWERISAPWNHEMRVITSVAIDPANPEVIYAGTPHLPWKTEDGGKTWNSIHEGMIDDTDVFSIFIDPEKPSRVLASACSGIYRSEDGGGGWTKFKGIPGTFRRTHVIRAAPGNPNVIYAGTTLGLLKSTDGGANFKRMNSHVVMSMAFDPENSNVLYLATEGSGLLKSTDGGQTTKALNQGFVNRKVLDVTLAGDRLYANTIQDGDAGGVFASGDHGSSWQLTANAEAIGDNHIHRVAGHPDNPQILYAANERRLWRSADAGKTWKAVRLPVVAKVDSVRVSALQMLPGKAPALYLGSDHGLWRSTDEAKTWTLVPITKANRTPNVLTLRVAAPRMLVQTGDTLYLSEDSGATWHPLSLLFSTSLIYDIAMSGRAEDPILLATAKGLYGSVDGGRTWTPRSRGLEPGTVTSVHFHPAQPGVVWLVQFGRLYESEDQGLTWKKVEGGEIRESSIRSLWSTPRIPNRLFALTPDLGMFYLDLSST